MTMKRMNQLIKNISKLIIPRFILNYVMESLKITLKKTQVWGVKSYPIETKESNAIAQLSSHRDEDLKAY